MARFFLFLLMLLSVNVQAVEYLLVTADSVRVRAEPSTQGRSILMLNKGHLVIKDGEKGDWTKIYFLGHEGTSGRTEGWMSSQFLSPEKVVHDNLVRKELRLLDKGASLSCERVIGDEYIQGCDLHLQYAVAMSQNLQKVKVNCSAELVAKTQDGKLIPVPVNQMLEHVALTPNEVLSMHILMKADLSYQLTEVSVEGHRCTLTATR